MSKFTRPRPPFPTLPRPKPHLQPPHTKKCVLNMGRGIGGDIWRRLPTRVAAWVAGNPAGNIHNARRVRHYHAGGIYTRRVCGRVPRPRASEHAAQIHQRATQSSGRQRLFGQRGETPRLLIHANRSRAGFIPAASGIYRLETFSARLDVGGAYAAARKTHSQRYMQVPSIKRVCAVCVWL